MNFVPSVPFVDKKIVAQNEFRALGAFRGQKISWTKMPFVPLVPFVDKKIRGQKCLSCL